MVDLEGRRQSQAASITARGITEILEHALPKLALKSLALLDGGEINLSYLLRFDDTEAPILLRIFVCDRAMCQKEYRYCAPFPSCCRFQNLFMRPQTARLTWAHLCCIATRRESRSRN